MYILKNAFISITRNKGRNILIGIIILVIACASTIALAINNTASDLINSYESAYDKELTITFDRSSMMKDADFSNRDNLEDKKQAFENIENYTINDITSFAKSDHIKSYYYTYNISLDGDNIEKAETEDGAKEMPQGKQREEEKDFSLMGYNSLASMSEFITGTYTMKEITDDAWDIAFNGNYIFINEELASYNNLKLNDKVKFKDSESTYEFEIIGIFKDNDENNNMDMFSSSVNTIVTNADSLISIADSNENLNSQINPTFIIDSYDNADKIQQEFYQKGLDENYIVETNQEVAESGLSGIQNIKSFAMTFLIITLIIGGVVLFVINMINIRERKYEIGVLRTIGISKLKLTFQFLIELLIVAFVSLLLGASIGALTSKNVSNYLLTNEIENSENSAKNMQENFGQHGEMRDNKEFNKIKGIPTIQAYDKVDAVVNLKVILELLTIGLGLVIISSVAGLISVQRFSPLTILKERS